MTEANHRANADVIDFPEAMRILAANWIALLAFSLTMGIIAIGITFVIAPTFTGRTTFIPPQQQQSATASALASLGALSSLAGNAGAAALRTPADQYVALMQSDTIANRLVDNFKLMSIYEAEFRVDARKKLAVNTHISVGKKDGIIAVEFDDHDAKRAAAVANQYVVELRNLTSHLALTEAQQRRVFFENQLSQTRDRLAAAQSVLQSSGFTESSLRAEPKAAADAYAQLKAESTAAEVRLNALRGSLTESAPEIQAQQAVLSSLRSHLAQLETNGQSNGTSTDYVSKYREFKYQETLFDLFSRQYESARLDESREGALIQVIDPATPPERRSKPKRGITAIITTLAAFALFSAFLLGRQIRRKALATQGMH